MKDEILSLMKELLQVANTFEQAYTNIKENPTHSLSEESYDDLLDSLGKAEHFLYANGGVKDKHGEPIYLGERVLSPHLLSDQYDVLELRKDVDGFVYFKNLTDDSQYDVHFLGSSEIQKQKK